MHTYRGLALQPRAAWLPSLLSARVLQERFCEMGRRHRDRRRAGGIVRSCDRRRWLRSVPRRPDARTGAVRTRRSCATVEGRAYRR